MGLLLGLLDDCPVFAEELVEAWGDVPWQGEFVCSGPLLGLCLHESRIRLVEVSTRAFRGL